LGGEEGNGGVKNVFKRKIKKRESERGGKGLDEQEVTIVLQSGNRVVGFRGGGNMREKDRGNRSYRPGDRPNTVDEVAISQGGRRKKKQNRGGNPRHRDEKYRIRAVKG